MQRYAVAVVVLVLAMMVVMVMAGCAAYDKAKDINISARTTPQEFNLDNDGFDKKKVESDTWKDHADDIQTVEKVEISYTGRNTSGAPVDLKVYISKIWNLKPEDLNDPTKATLVHKRTLPENDPDDPKDKTTIGRNDAEIENLQDVKKKLKEYEGKFTVYVVAESISETVLVDIEDFQVYGTFNADLL